MSVDFSSSYPVTTALAGKPGDIRTLQEAFAAVLRNHGTEKGGTTADTMLEVLQTAKRTENTAGNDRNQQRREHLQQSDRNDYTNVDRKLLDKSEMRSSEMNSVYRDRTDRNETLRSDYRERSDHGEQPQSTIQVSTASSITPAAPPDVIRPGESVPHREYSPPQSNIPTTAGTNSSSSSTNAPTSTANIGLTNVSIPGGNVPVAIPRPATLPVNLQAFTVFTPSGRLGQTQRKTNEREDEDEPVEEKDTQKHLPFATFEAIRLAPQDVSRQPRELTVKPELRQVTEKPHEKPERETPREVEPNQSRNIKTLDEFLNTPAQNIAGVKKGEPNQPNQTQYLNRIAAACEAVSHHAPIRIKVNLDHLGTLTLRFFHKANKLTLRFEAPSEESAQFLCDHLDGLWAILSKRNVKIADIEILLDS